MRLSPCALLLLASLAFVSCKQEEPEPPPPSTPMPTPAPTPVPASAAMERAVQLYPDLGKKGSLFNRAFLEHYEEARRNHPNTLMTVDWPIDLAHRTAATLGVNPEVDTPAPATPIVIIKDYHPPSELDRGAYNNRRELPAGRTTWYPYISR